MPHKLPTWRICVVSLSLFAANANADLPRARELYFAALAGTNSALAEASQLLTTLAKQDSSNATVTAYLGSVRLLEAAHTWAIFRKGELVKIGLALLDQAVTAAPDNEEIRFIRAASTYHLPGFFKRRPQSESDFAWLAGRVREAVSTGRLDAQLGAAALFHDGIIKIDRGDKPTGLTQLRAAVEIAPDSPAGRDATKKLATLTRGS